VKGSFKIGTLFGIGVYLHFTFLLLLAFFAWAELQATGSVVAAAETLLFVGALFLCLVMHEYGHALTARRFGIKTKDITLLPIGGVARLERMPDKPWQELLVAIMGPMVNVVIAILIVGSLSLKYGFGEVAGSLWPLRSIDDSFWMDLARINILLILFNMLPAFPMDGGRVVRSLLAMVLPYERATAVAALLGKGMAVLFFLEALGLNAVPFIHGEHNILLGFIAVFVWIGAGSEARFAMLKSRLHSIPVSQAMVSNFRTLSPRDTVEWAGELAMSGLQHDFPVADEGRVVGMLFKSQLEAALARQEPYLRVSDVMVDQVPTVTSSDMLEDVMTAVIASGLPIVPVTSRGLLVGLLPIERLLTPPGPGSAAGVRPLGRSAEDRMI